jgi:hypothetical protein
MSLQAAHLTLAMHNIPLHCHCGVALSFTQLLQVLNEFNKRV